MARHRIRFAHPAEADIARLLDFYGVAWQYEPTTFALVTGDRGQPIQSFTPDFYLPEHDIFIEMTTMRQSLVTRKNRKFRLLRELYPTLNVKLLYRKDVELILDRYTGTRAEAAEGIIPQLVIRADQIKRRAAEMAEALVDGASRSFCLLALGEGALCTRDLVADSLMATNCEVISGLIAADRCQLELAACSIRLDQPAKLDIRGRNVVVVADIIGTGLTAEAALRWLRAQGAEQARLISLLDRHSARLVDVPLLVAGFPVSSHWHIGGGLGESKRLSELPDIHILKAPPAA
jgi:hypoxanthine phosphoribosyltransferase